MNLCLETSDALRHYFYNRSILGEKLPLQYFPFKVLFVLYCQIILIFFYAICYMPEINVVFDSIEGLQNEASASYVLPILRANPATFFILCVYLCQRILKDLHYTKYLYFQAQHARRVLMLNGITLLQYILWANGILLFIILLAFLGYQLNRVAPIIINFTSKEVFCLLININIIQKSSNNYFKEIINLLFDIIKIIKQLNPYNTRIKTWLYILRTLSFLLLLIQYGLMYIISRNIRRKLPFLRSLFYNHELLCIIQMGICFTFKLSAMFFFASYYLFRARLETIYVDFILTDKDNFHTLILAISARLRRSPLRTVQFLRTDFISAMLGFGGPGGPHGFKGPKYYKHCFVIASCLTTVGYGAQLYETYLEHKISLEYDYKTAILEKDSQHKADILQKESQHKADILQKESQHTTDIRQKNYEEMRLKYETYHKDKKYWDSLWWKKGNPPKPPY
jgi:hypothetical protein